MINKETRFLCRRSGIPKNAIWTVCMDGSIAMQHSRVYSYRKLRERDQYAAQYQHNMQHKNTRVYKKFRERDQMLAHYRWQTPPNRHLVRLSSWTHLLNSHKKCRQNCKGISDASKKRFFFFFEISAEHYYIYIKRRRRKQVVTCSYYMINNGNTSNPPF